MRPHADFFNDKKILIIGGAGFIGSHLVERLIEYSKNITVIDNYFTGNTKNHVSSVSYLNGDAREMLKTLTHQNFDLIFHFGEYSRVEKSLKEPCLALEYTYASFPSVLEFWRHTGAKLIYSGSSTKFSENGSGRHLSPYTAAKALNTELLVDYSKWYKLPYTIVYFYNVYGGRELSQGDYATVVGKFKNLIANGAKSLPVNAPGTQRRHFTHVSDVVEGILIAASLGEGDGYGIGAKESYSILELCEIFGCKPLMQSASQGNRIHGELIDQKIIELGWKQRRFLKEDIKEFLESEITSKGDK